MDNLARRGTTGPLPQHYILRNGANYFGWNDRPTSLECVARNYCVRAEAEAEAAALGAGWSVEPMPAPVILSEAA